jgi:hypothetical protein
LIITKICAKLQINSVNSDWWDVRIIIMQKLLVIAGIVLLPMMVGTPESRQTAFEAFRNKVAKNFIQKKQLKPEQPNQQQYAAPARSYQPTAAELEAQHTAMCMGLVKQYREHRDTIYNKNLGWQTALAFIKSIPEEEYVATTILKFKNRAETLSYFDRYLAGEHGLLDGSHLLYLDQHFVGYFSGKYEKAGCTITEGAFWSNVEQNVL